MAAPPDDGGGQGSFTRPEDTLQHAPRDDARQNPELSYFPPKPLEEQRGPRADLALFAIMIASVIVLLAIYLYACP